MVDKNEILDKLSKIDKNSFGILKIGLFGSFAKDEQKEDSDIDILVSLDEEKDIIANLFKLKEYLESEFKHKIDIITMGQFDYKYKNPLVAEYKEKVKKEILGSVIYV